MRHSETFPVSRTMIKYLAMYLCITITVITLLLPIYFIACDNAERIIDQEQAQHVSKGFWEVSSSLQQCQAYAYNLACNTDIVRLSLADEKEPDLALYLYNLTLYQKNNLWDNSLVQEVIVQFTRNNTLLTRHSVYNDKKSFYNRFFKYDTLSYDAWQQSLFNEKAAARDNTGIWSYDGGNNHAVTFNYYYPNTSAPLTVISIIIPTENLLSELMTDDIYEYGSLHLICDVGGTELNIKYDSGHSSDVNLLSLSSLQPRLMLKAGLSRIAYAQATYPIHYTLLVYILVAFLAALTLSIAFTHLNMRPLEAVIGFISQLGIRAGEYRGNAYAYIRQVLAGVTNSEEQLREAYDLVQTSFEHMVFNMAVKGLRVGTDHLICALGHIPALKGSYVLVGISREPLVGDWPPGYNTDIAMAIAKRLFMEQTKEAYLYESDLLYAVLNIEAQGGMEALDNRLQDINRSLSDTIKVVVRFGISQEFSELSRLNEAADQVVCTLKVSRPESSPPVMWYERTAVILPSPVPINKDILDRLLVQEEEVPLRTFFENLLCTIDSELRFSPLYSKTVYYSVLAVFQSVLVKLSLDGEILLKEYNPLTDSRNNIQYLYDTGLQIRTAACTRRHVQKSELTCQVLDYIRKHYASPNLCLTMVADHFALSERYLSTLLREQTGCNYSDHVENIRMAEARRLLVQTNVPVNDIAGYVGYDRTNSFYKSFKRCTGLSPRQYRADAQ